MGPNVRAVLEIIHREGLHERDPGIDQLRIQCELGMADESFAEALLPGLHDLAEQVRQKSLYLRRAPTFQEIYPNGPPDLVLGNGLEGERAPIGIHLTGPTHCLYIGAAGFGKTVGMRGQVQAQDAWNAQHAEYVSMIIPDFKGDYQDIPRRNRGRWLHLHALHGLHFGLNAPLGVPPNVWINIISTIFCVRFSLLASWATLANTIRWLLAVLNPKPAGRLRWPSLRLILEVLLAAPPLTFSSKPDYTASLIQKLTLVCDACPELFDTFNGFEVNRDVIEPKRSAVIALPSLYPPELDQFIAELLVAQAYFSRLHRGLLGDRPVVQFIIDESDGLVSEDMDKAYQGMSILSLGARRGRELGIDLSLGLSSLAIASHHARNSASYLFHFKVWDDLSKLAGARTLDLGQRGSGLLAALEPGECVVRQSGPWSHAVFAKTRYVAPCREVTPEYDVLDYIPAQSLEELAEVREALDGRIAEANCTRLRQGIHRTGGVPEAARDLLFLAIMHPDTPFHQLVQRLAKTLSNEKQIAVREQLKQAGLAKCVSFRQGKTQVYLVDVLKEGYALFNKPVPDGRGRGDVRHSYMCHCLEEYGKAQGADVAREVIVSGTSHPVDVLWRLPSGHSEAFEVVNAVHSNVPGHLHKCLLQSTAIHTVTVVAATKRELLRVRKLVDAEISLTPVRDCIKYEAISTFMKD